jgi:hypothetical protein
MLIYQKDTKKMIAIDARETAPIKSSETMYSQNPMLALKGSIQLGIQIDFHTG